MGLGVDLVHLAGGGDRTAGEVGVRGHGLCNHMNEEVSAANGGEGVNFGEPLLRGEVVPGRHPGVGAVAEDGVGGVVVAVGDLGQLGGGIKWSSIAKVGDAGDEVGDGGNGDGEVGAAGREGGVSRMDHAGGKGAEHVRGGGVKVDPACDPVGDDGDGGIGIQSKEIEKLGGAEAVTGEAAMFGAADSQGGAAAVGHSGGGSSDVVDFRVVGGDVPSHGIENIAQLKNITPDASVVEFLDVVVGGGSARRGTKRRRISLCDRTQVVRGIGMAPVQPP